MKKSKEAEFGYDAMNGKYGNMSEPGIVDPVKVTRTALENAASIATMILITESLVTDIPEPPSAAAAPTPPMDYQASSATTDQLTERAVPGTALFRACPQHPTGLSTGSSGHRDSRARLITSCRR